MCSLVTFMFRDAADNGYTVTARHLDETYLLRAWDSRVVRCYTSEFSSQFKYWSHSYEVR